MTANSLDIDWRELKTAYIVQPFIFYIRQGLLWVDSYVHEQNLINDVNRRYRDNLMILVQAS